MTNNASRVLHDSSHLAPKDALGLRMPSQMDGAADANATLNAISAGHAQALRNAAVGDGPHRTREQRRKDRSKSRRRKGVWKKLLWVRQSYHDNYTDEATFLDALQRNPRVRPYEFWPLVADSTVIVQQFCTLIVFVCCFHGIIRERVSPITVVAWGSVGTVLGWLLWDSWVGQEFAQNATVEVAGQPDIGPFPVSRSVSHKDLQGLVAQHGQHGQPLFRSASYKDLRSASQVDLHALGSGGLGIRSRPPSQTGLHGLGLHSQNHSRRTSSSFKLAPISEPMDGHGFGHGHQLHSPSPLATPGQSAVGPQRPGTQFSASTASLPHFPPMSMADSSSDSTTYTYYPPLGTPSSRLSPRAQQRLATAKSAFLIYFVLLGLSPILKSLTLSTASDSIWAIAFWLMVLNFFSFDYGSGMLPPVSNSSGISSSTSPDAAGGTGFASNSGTSFPASLSTNAAIMASTVLASRLPTTTHVFSLMLFSIEVFGLFPVFRRYLRHFSWLGHLYLTWALVIAAGGGMAVCISGGSWWKAGLAGAVLGSLLVGLAMGVCSWWLLGLQRFKNEIYGPWDPARPIIRRWD